MNRYLFSIRSHLEGPQVLGWHEITNDDHATKSAIFAMDLSAKMNMATPLLLIKSTKAWTFEEMETYIRSLSVEKLGSFIKEATL